MSECSRAGGSGRVEQKMDPSLPLLSCESSVLVKENPDRKKEYRNKKLNIPIKACQSKEENTNLIYLNSNGVKWLFFKPIKVFWSIVAQKNKTNKSKKMFAGVTEKYLKTDESLNTYGKLSERN